MARQLQLFGEGEYITTGRKRSGTEFFDDYEAFVEKFRPKRTTDDCYTPPEVYDAILEWLGENADLSGKRIMRPFHPGGDYMREYYPDNAAVVDNPPFSILAQITKYYSARRIPFFLFAPALTLFGAMKGTRMTAVITGKKIVYDNGANINTAFRSNMFGDLRIWGCPELAIRIKEAQKAARTKKSSPKYIYPGNVITSTAVEYVTRRGAEIRIRGCETRHISKLESQARVGKAVFGSGFLLSDNAAARMEAARMGAKRNVVVWELSDAEKRIIKQLNESGDERTEK